MGRGWNASLPTGTPFHLQPPKLSSFSLAQIRPKRRIGKKRLEIQSTNAHHEITQNQAPLAALLLAITVTVPSCSQQSTTPKPKPSLLIEPNAGVGPLRKGMSQSQVEAAVGKPEREGNRTWRYPQLGLRVLFDKQGIIASVHCRKGFKGTTAEGIGIGATRAELIQAFGEPTGVKDSKRADENLTFATRNLNCILEGDRLVQLGVHLDTP